MKDDIISLGRGLDQLSFGVQQDGVGVRFGSEDPVAVVEVIGERLGDLVGAAVVVVLVSLVYRLGRVPNPLMVQVWVLLALHRNQGRRKTRVLQDREKPHSWSEQKRVK